MEAPRLAEALSYGVRWLQAHRAAGADGTSGHEFATADRGWTEPDYGSSRASCKRGLVNQKTSGEAAYSNRNLISGAQGLTQNRTRFQAFPTPAGGCCRTADFL